MVNKEISSAIKEYYDIVAPILAYEPCEESIAIERSVLEFLCAIRNDAENLEACWQAIEQARCLQSGTDGNLLGYGDFNRDSVIFDLKMEVLQEHKVIKPKRFDATLFADEVREDANLGMRNACKLLACMNWLGLIMPQNTQVAMAIWRVLATNGEWSALDALIYTARQLGDAAQQEKWSHILSILEAEYDSFSPIALCSEYQQFSEDEVQYANLIMFIKQKNVSQNRAMINRPMLHYVIESKESYETKMSRLSADTNYFFVMHQQDRKAAKKIGF